MVRAPAVDRDQEPGQVRHGEQRRALAPAEAGIRQVTHTSAARPMPSPTATSAAGRRPRSSRSRAAASSGTNSRVGGRGETMSVAVASATGQMPMPRPPSGVAMTAMHAEGRHQDEQAENDEPRAVAWTPLPLFVWRAPRATAVCGQLLSPTHDDRPHRRRPRRRSRGCRSPSVTNGSPSPTRPSIDSRIRSAWPVCRAYSSTMSTSIRRRLGGSAHVGPVTCASGPPSVRNAATAARDRATAASHSGRQLLGESSAAVRHSQSGSASKSTSAHGAGMVCPRLSEK